MTQGRDAEAAREQAISELVELYAPAEQGKKTARSAKARYDELMRKGAWAKRLSADDPNALKDALNEFASLAKEMGAADDSIATELDVRARVRLLRVLADRGEPLWGTRKDNVQAIENFREQLEVLQGSLRALPKAALFLLFSPQTSGEGHNIPSKDTQDRALAHLRSLTGMLQLLRSRSLQLAEDKIGAHGNADYLKQIVCDHAWDFMLIRDKQPTNSSSETSLFRKTSELLFQALTGKRDSLEHACRDAYSRKADLTEKKRKSRSH